MILALINFDGDDEMKLYYNNKDLQKDLFCPDHELIWMTDFKIKGKTYAERKGFAEDIGIMYSNYFGTWYPSYLELADVYEQLDKIAHKYGLVKEFRINGVI
jgi:hypothetical protein